MRSSGTYKKILSILTVSIIAIIFSITIISCSSFVSGEGAAEEAGADPANGIAEPDEPDMDKPDTDSGQAVTEDEKKDIAVKIWIENIIPEKISSEIVNFLKGDPGIEIVPLKEQAQVVLEILPAGAIPGGPDTYEDLDIYYIMAPVVSFYNISDGTGWEEIRDWWSGDAGALDGVFGGNDSSSMMLADVDYKILEKMLGKPVNEKIQIIGEGAVQDSLRIVDRAIAITSFDNIEKQFKVLSVNGVSVFDRQLDYNDYPLAFSVMLTGTDGEAVKKAAGSLEGLEITNRDMSRFTSLMMTGVTAMARSRSIGKGMDKLGIVYPAEKIADILKSADITHINNEIPFVEDCPGKGYPFFCSDPDYIELLRYVGTDVIELTGNHMNDYGHDWMLYTLAMYENEEWPYFGGGRNLEDCYSPAILESNGHKFAFLGFNWWGPPRSWATEEKPGSAPRHFEEFEERIKELKDQGYIVVFTFQYYEAPQYYPTDQQIIDFRRMVDAGANIVSGSQSHYPMGVEIYNNGFINYGLGNLFFDMGFNKLGLKQGIIAKHIFYDGKHINTVLITTMLEGEWNISQRVMLANPEERIQILESIFKMNIK
ncbi:MAG: hypothetical protein E3J58_05365 [Actinomycetota bacterium]|nr:MAG: hypothetical protein E3J58_05365 [Actinomycetota bacterium]